MQEQYNLSERSYVAAGVDHTNGAEPRSDVGGAQSDNQGLPPGYFDGGLGI
jgi:hypothetical protein